MSAATVLDSIALLHRLAHSMRTREPIAPADADAVADAIERLVAARGELSLEQAFGLTGDDNRRIWPAVSSAHVRDAAISEYARRFCAGEIPAQARTIASEIANYGRRHWAADRANGLSETYRDTPRGFLFEIFRFGEGKAPESVKQIRRVLRSHCSRMEIIGHAPPYGRVPPENLILESTNGEKPHAATRRQNTGLVQRRGRSGGH